MTGDRIDAEVGLGALSMGEESRENEPNIRVALAHYGRMIAFASRTVAEVDAALEPLNLSMGADGYGGWRRWLFRLRWRKAVRDRLAAAQYLGGLHREANAIRKMYAARN